MFHRKAFQSLMVLGSMHIFLQRYFVSFMHVYNLNYLCLNILNVVFFRQSYTQSADRTLQPGGRLISGEASGG